MPNRRSASFPSGRRCASPFCSRSWSFSPESGFKFKVMVERSCTPEADAIWKLVFDLFRVSDMEIEIVHVLFHHR